MTPTPHASWSACACSKAAEPPRRRSSSRRCGASSSRSQGPDRLRAAERHALERAAVSGREFWPGAVAALDGGDEALGPTLLGLVRRDLVETAASSIPGAGGFRFRHALIRDAAYDGIPKRTRA